MKQLNRIFWVVLIVAYVGFIYSSYGILVFSKKVEGGIQGALQCNYFTGIDVVQKEYWYSPNGLLGREACPRTIYFGEEHAQTQ